MYCIHRSIALCSTFNSHHKVCVFDNDCIINYCPIHSQGPCVFLFLKNKIEVKRKDKKICTPETMFYHVLIGIKKPLKDVLLK